MKRWIGTALIVAGLSVTSAQAEAACGKVTIADMNWNSATLIAHVDRFILEHGYGCDAEIVTGDTMPTGTSMVEKGEPDVAPEFWINNFKEALAKGIEEKRLRIAGDALLDGGEEGFWVPQYLVDKDPSLATLSGIKANADMFEHPEDPAQSAFYTCPAGWGCQVANANLYRALNLEDAGFDLVDPGTGPALAGTIAKAYDRKNPWFGYYWAPTAILGKYKMVKVDFESGIKRDHFDNCITQEICENPQPTMYPPSPVKTLVVENFAARAPEAFDYLANRGYTNAQMNEMLAWMEDNQAAGDLAMEHFLENYEHIWVQWVPSEVEAKVKLALTNL